MIQGKLATKENLIWYSFFWLILGGVIVGVAAVSVWAWLAGYRPQQTGQLGVYGAVPDFSLTERSGEKVARSDLLGHVWVADLIFTHCAATCPRMSEQMKRLQDAFPRGEILLVSITVDPERDTPEVLSKYADQYGAQHGRWLFLTGDEETIQRLAIEGFNLSAEPSEESHDAHMMEMPILHSDRFVLVDRRGTIRGYYEGISDEGLEQLREDIRAVLRERV